MDVQNLKAQQAAVDSAQATLKVAQRQIDTLRAQRASAEANLAQAQAQRDQAKLNLGYTTVMADQPGRVVNLTGAVGQYAQAGTNLTMFVPDEIWIVANYKETQLDRMRPGQPVDIEIDAYPDRDFHGRVASVQPGSGPAFSLLPPENATGNYVKIVQRVPVKIILDNPPRTSRSAPACRSSRPCASIRRPRSMSGCGPASSGGGGGCDRHSGAGRRRPAGEQRSVGQSLADRHPGRARGLHGGARHHDRQRGPALYRRRHGGQR